MTSNPFTANVVAPWPVQPAMLKLTRLSGVAAGQPFAMENEMLDMVESGRTPTSRLSCQLVASQELDGIRMKVTW